MSLQPAVDGYSPTISVSSCLNYFLGASGGYIHIIASCIKPAEMLTCTSAHYHKCIRVHKIMWSDQKSLRSRFRFIILRQGMYRLGLWIYQLRASQTVPSQNTLSVSVYGAGSSLGTRGSTFQMLSAYSSIHLSLEKNPILATVVIVLVVHSSVFL